MVDSLCALSVWDCSDGDDLDGDDLDVDDLDVDDLDGDGLVEEPDDEGLVRG